MQINKEKLCAAIMAEEPGALYKHEPPAWRITVYRGAFTTPAWFCEGIAYQIFPDRFCRSSWEAMYERAGAHRARGRRVRLHDRVAVSGWRGQRPRYWDPGWRDEPLR